MLEMNNLELDTIENSIDWGKVSKRAFAEAHKVMRDAGFGVLATENGKIYEYSPDGSKRFIKNIEPPTPCVKRKKIII